MPTRRASLCLAAGCTEPKVAGRGQHFCAAHKEERLLARKRQKHADWNARLKVKRSLARAKQAKPKRQPSSVPADVREAWSRAHPNSVIRRKFPTTKALQGHDWTKEAA